MQKYWTVSSKASWQGEKKKKEIGVNSEIAEGKQWHRKCKTYGLDEWEVMQDVIVKHLR